VVRLYEFHDEVHYVVRQTDGPPLAVPGWMTNPEAAYVNMVSTARLPLCVLRELRRIAVSPRGDATCAKRARMVAESPRCAEAAYCLHSADYNLCRIHKTLRATPATEPGITACVWALADLLA
jgi:hypothetical protein